jgi:uncharacterized protein
LAPPRRELQSIRVLPQGRLAAAIRLEKGARWGWLQPALAGVMIAAALGIAMWRAAPLLATAPLLDGPRWLRLLWSLFSAAAAALAVEQVQRYLLGRSGSLGHASRRLFLSMQSKIREPTTLVFAGTTVWSAFAEELLFRGALVPLIRGLPTIGTAFSALFGSALLFGLVHYSRERGALLWPISAAIFGLGLGTIFLCTGELVGPILAHILVNVRLGGLMRANQSTGIGPPKKPAKRKSHNTQAPE